MGVDDGRGALAFACVGEPASGEGAHRVPSTLYTRWRLCAPLARDASYDGEVSDAPPTPRVPPDRHVSRPALRGTILALVSAVAFGVTTPLVQRLGRDVGSFATAALLYGGAAAVGLGSRSRSEAQPGRAHASRLAIVAVFGAGLAPAALAWGLAHASGTSASLMLNLEAVFTIVLARVLYAEHVGRRVALAAVLLVVGGALLVVERGTGGASAGAQTSALGLLAIAGASLGWALDNALAKPLSSLDPAAVVMGKGAIGAALSTAAALALGERWPSVGAAAGIALLGATGYGMSLRLYLRAQRALGAGRTASVFAAAPFVGAALAWALGEPAGVATVAAGAIMIVGLALHMTEQHEHEHEHEPIEHEHAHRHDDGHHDDHTHPEGEMPDGEHTHVHTHARRRHDHPHVPDLHHAHGHDHEGGHEGGHGHGHGHGHEHEHEHGHTH
ncbi:MAG: DMT family transporter [Deltaproteobacteria bacterium]|nr:DMT family transporter [Deltaproteobacteria bacterium]